MTDQRFTELLGKQLAGEISPEESTEFKTLLASNESYQQEYQSLSTYFSKKEAPGQNVDEVFNRITTKISTKEGPAVQPLKASMNYSIWLKVAAVIVLIACGFLAYKTFLTTTQPAAELVWKLANTPAKSVKKLTLADGTTVTLNAVSELKYPANFTGNTREVYLTGEAFFDVHKDATHPFIIHTDKIQVKVLGTAFDVKAYKNDAFTETTLIRGRVEVRLNDNSNQKFVLQPNDKFVLHNQKKEASMEQLHYFAGQDPATIIETSWTNNRLTFKNSDFASITNQFERWYGIKIMFENEKLKNLKFTGQFTQESITEVLDALKMIEHFNYKIKDQTVYIYH
ncbi:FecR family protein [Pedobacter sp. HDW13]|uniref:FecR family protein n=1 Tax=Pedobacter sp. HDW13 TaxID=2714940 RepID=UPI00140C4678|nr:FecR family protein [Pedobacter sp. HDW13]QIL42256.1 FecR family protein [Pedobacter sp. HDW13]